MNNIKNDNDVRSAPDYRNAVAKMHNIDPIITSESNFFMGRTKDGQIIYFPDSYRIGYRNFLNSEKPAWIQLDFIVVGQLSDGNWVFLPSYRDGINDAKNELKFSILAESQRRIFEDNSIANEKLEELKRESEELYKENENIKLQLEKQHKIADEDNKQKDEMQRQLKDIQDKLSKIEQQEGSKKDTDSKTYDKSPISKKKIEGHKHTISYN